MTISEFMSQDHDRLDAIFSGFRSAKDPSEARGLFARFASGLRAHISWEEDILFPVFEERTGMRDAGPTAVMRAEHRQIQEMLARIDARLAGAKKAAGEEEALLGVLGPHNDKEEGVLYPSMDHMLSSEEVKKALAAMARAPVAA